MEVTQRPLDGKKALNLLRMDLERGDGDKRLGLIAAITGSKRKRFVLLGGAGSGKTTFVNYLTYLLATTYDTGEKPDLPEKIAGLMPVRIVLRRAARQSPRMQLRHCRYDLQRAEIRPGKAPGRGG